jgi:hypothetical protein
MLNSASAFLKLCSPSDLILLRWRLAPNRSWLALSLHNASRTPRESDGPCGLSSPPGLGVLSTGMMHVAGQEEVVCGQWSLSIHSGRFIGTSLGLADLHIGTS